MMPFLLEEQDCLQELFLILREGIGLPIKMGLRLSMSRLMQITEFSLLTMLSQEMQFLILLSHQVRNTLKLIGK